MNQPRSANRPRLIRLPLALLLALLAGTANAAGTASTNHLGSTDSASGQDTQVLKVTGEAVIYQNNRPQARQRALDEAFATALTRIMGSLISAESFSHNFESIDRGVYGRTQGYIKTYQILASSEDGGLLSLQVQVTVSTQAIKDDLEALGILLDALDNPSLRVTGSEQGLTSPQSLAVIRNALMAQGIRVINGAEPTAAADADLVIKLSGSIQNQTEIVGVGMHGAVVELHADAYWQQEQRLLLSEHSIANAAAGNAPAALSRAYQDAATRLAPQLIERLTEAWRNEAYNSRLVAVSASGSHQQTRRLLSRLSRVFGVRKASLKGYHDGRAQLSVRFTGSAALLAELIARTRFDTLTAEITEVGQNRLSLNLSPSQPDLQLR